MSIDSVEIDNKWKEWWETEGKVIAEQSFADHLLTTSSDLYDEQNLETAYKIASKSAEVTARFFKEYLMRTSKQVNEWCHVICQPCWRSKNPNRKVKAIKLADNQIEKCCFCSKMTKAGIHVREDPSILACQGNHEAYK